MAWRMYKPYLCAGMKSGSLYKHLIGKIVLVPGSEFGVDVPEFYYKGIAPQTLALPWGRSKVCLTVVYVILQAAAVVHRHMCSQLWEYLTI